MCPWNCCRYGAASLGIRAVRNTVLLALLLGTNAVAHEPWGPGFDPWPLRIPSTVKGDTRPITSTDLVALREPKGLSISPDKKYVAFVVGQAVLETNCYRSAVYVVSTTEGAVPKNLGSAGPPHWDEINQWLPEAPQWSPDSRSFTYRMKSRVADQWQVWQWRAGDRTLRQLTSVPGNVVR